MTKILIIDDDVDFGDLTRRRLLRMGFEAKLHGGSRGVMDLLLRDEFALVILDVNMPGLAGPDVMKMIRTSAAPSTHAGAPRAVIFDSVVKAVALCARLSSDWSSELISCCRITTYAVSDRIAIDTPRATVVRTATRDARDRR